MGVASESACITDMGVQIKCIITDYLSRDRPTETPIILFHPNGSRFTNQTSTIKYGSSLFFSGSLTSIEGILYLELHNFSFVRGQSLSSTSAKHMPWLNSSKSSTSVSRISVAQAIHNKSQQTHNPLPKTPVTSITQHISDALPETVITTTQSDSSLPFTPPITPVKNQKTRSSRSQSTAQKRKTRSSIASNKLPKISDIASNILAEADPKNDSENSN